VPSWLAAPRLWLRHCLRMVGNESAVIIAELKAIRENLDKLWADRAEEDGGGRPKS